jgi:hypothetical protein
MRKISSSILIEATPEKVWDVLMAFERYPDWNPYILEAKGARVEGERLEVRMRPPGGKAVNFRPRVTSVVERMEFAWKGRLLLPKLFDGEHRFTLDDLGDHLRFTQEESFSGLMVPFTKKLLERTREGFRLMNIALKERAEGLT